MRRFVLALVPLLALAARALPQEEEKPKDPLEEARALKDEAEGFFNTSGNTDLSRKERAEARKEAYVRLKKAMALLDGYLEEHPDEAESLEDLYSEIAMMLYWIRKEAAVGELEGDKPAPPKEEGEAPEEAPDGRIEAPPPPSAADVLSEIEEYEKKFPGDVPGLHERYKDFLSEFPDTSTPEYARAVERLEKLDKRLKDVYRLVRDDDPDSLENVDDAKVLKLISQLSADLEKGSPPVRERAAKFLGALGSGEAADPLIDVLKSDEPGDPVFEAAAEALAKIGGRRVCRKLLRVKQRSPLGPTVVDILCMTVEGGGVSARIAGEALAEYVEPFDPDLQHQVVSALKRAGKDGALGLSKALHMAPVKEKVELIEHLGKAGDPRVAGDLATFLIVNPSGARRKQHQAARAAILEIGKPGVKYLIPVLDEKKYAVWTAEMLRKITGVRLKDDKRRTWERWYRENRREFEGQ